MPVEEVWCDEIVMEMHFSILKQMLNGYNVMHSGYEIVVTEKGSTYPVAIIRPISREIMLKKKELRDVMLEFGNKLNYKKLIKCWREEKKGEK